MMRYLKAIIPGVITILYGVGAALEDGGIDATERNTLIGGAITTLLVYLIPNKPAAPADNQ